MGLEDLVSNSDSAFCFKIPSSCFAVYISKDTRFNNYSPKAAAR